MKQALIIAYVFFLNLSLSAKEPILDGKWIVTKFSSAYPDDKIKDLDDIKKNLGRSIVIHIADKVLVDNLYGTQTIFRDVSFSEVYAPVKEFFIRKYASNIGFSNDSVRAVYVKAKGLLKTLYFLTDDIIVVVDKDFIYYLNKVEEMYSYQVTSKELSFYTDATLTRKFKFHIVKGDKITLLLRQRNAAFVNYQNHGKEYHGWVNLNFLSKNWLWR